MLVFGIILTTVSVIGLILMGVYADNESDVGLTILMTLTLVLGCTVIAASTESKISTKSTKNNFVEIEIRQEIINGSMVNCDTIYIFTKKEK